jgi:hypothetical protein
MEWVQDWLGNYTADAAENPTGPASGKVKVEKGGWWGGRSWRHVRRTVILRTRRTMVIIALDFGW